MSQTKYKMPKDVKNQCICLVQGYERRVRLYHQRREKILYNGTLPNDGQPKGNNASDAVCDRVLQLEKLEEHADTIAMRAVEGAKLHIGLDLTAQECRKLTNAIWDSCVKGRYFTFSYYNLAMGKTNFYERKRKFLYEIAKNMGYI